MSIDAPPPPTKAPFEARRPYSKPSHLIEESFTFPARKIRFLHPGYPERNNILLQFSAVDGKGIHYETALDACAVVANNRWDGFFSTDRNGQNKVQNLLDQDEYYFHLSKAANGTTTPELSGKLANRAELDKNYPIVPSFSEWQFPHNNLPDHWSSLVKVDLDAGLLSPPANCCCMTKSSLALENAHIVPTNPSDQKWFNSNLMSRYASIDSPSNTIRLRVDVHQLFDRKPQFAIVPKYGRLVAHFFSADEVEAVQLYHNVPLHPLNGKDVCFLLARMAWTVFPQLGIFMKARVSRKLVRLVNEAQEIQDTDGDRCDQIFKGARSRSASPRKRQAGQMTQAQEFEEYLDYSDGDGDGEQDWECWTRGRKRRRSSCDYIVRCSRSFTLGGGKPHRSGSEVSESTDAAVLSSLQT